jgi:hypothetical protein
MRNKSFKALLSFFALGLLIPIYHYRADLESFKERSPTPGWFI